MKASIISAITALASFAVAFPTVKTTMARRDTDTVDSFLLKPAVGSPDAIAGLEHVQWDGTVNGNMGWFPENGNAKDAKVFIQYNSGNGIAFYSRDTAIQVYLRPTHGTPSYFAKMGNPELLENEPIALLLQTNFTLDTSDGIEYFGYNHNWENMWVGCGSDDSYTLYFGGNTRDGCTAPFSLVTEHVGKDA